MLDAPDVLELLLSIGRRVLVGVVLKQTRKDLNFRIEGVRKNKLS
jgi:hypothetical protein